MNINQPVSPAWYRQRELKKEHIPTPEHIYHMATSFNSPRKQALFVLTYLTGGRISEIVRINYLKKNTYTFITEKNRHGVLTSKIQRNSYGSPCIEVMEKVPYKYLGIRKCDINFKTVKGKDILVISMDNRKNRKFKKKLVPIPIHKEIRLTEILRLYTDTLKYDEPLFPFGISTAEKIIGEVGLNPHFLRDIRLTHLVTEYDFNTFQLVKFAGWSSIAPAERYIRLGLSDLTNNF